MNHITPDNDEHVAIDLQFKQLAFVIKQLNKVEIEDLNLSDSEDVRLTARKSFHVSEVRNFSDGTLLLEVSLHMRVFAVSEGEHLKDIDLDRDNIPIFIDAQASVIFDITSAGESAALDVIFHKLLIAQSNVQITDVVNNILMNSELKGDRLSYDII